MRSKDLAIQSFALVIGIVLLPFFVFAMIALDEWFLPAFVGGFLVLVFAMAAWMKRKRL